MRLEEKISIRRGFFYFALFAPMLIFACASQREVQAFREFREFERSYRPRPKLPPIDEDSTLENLAAYALFENPGVEAAFNRWRAALLRLPQERTLPNPRLKYMYFFDPFITEGGEMVSDLAIMQEFPWPSKLWLQRDVALDEARAEGHLFEAEQLRVLRDVYDAYYEFYYWSQSVEIAREHLLIVRQLERVARAAYEAGRATNADVIRAQVELGRLENELRTVVLLRKPVVARLNALLNRPPDAPLPEPQPPEEEKLDVADEILRARMIENNPELQALDAEANARGRGIALARTRYLPDFGVEASFMGMESASPSRPFAVGKKQHRKKTGWKWYIKPLEKLAEL